MNNEIYHHGVKGQRWGVRRYQNYDGSLTAKGRERYEKDSGSSSKNDTSASASVKQAANKKNQEKLKAFFKKYFSLPPNDVALLKGQITFKEYLKKERRQQSINDVVRESNRIFNQNVETSNMWFYNNNLINSINNNMMGW